MSDTELSSLLKSKFPTLAQSGDIIADIVAQAKLVQLPIGKVLLDAGDTISHIPLVLSGSLKVVRADADGHEILLYYIHPGESCALTLSSSLKREKSKIKAVVQQAATLLVIPAEANWQFARAQPLWLDFVLEAYHQRFDELLHLVEEIGFKHLDERLLKYLNDKFELLGQTIIPLSHQEIADDLGTARVVVSRMLKQLERKGLVALKRGRIVNKQK